MKTKILKELNDLLNSYDFPQYFPEECNAQYIAQKFQIKRNTASKHLNELMEQKSCENQWSSCSFFQSIQLNGIYHIH